jgi:ABC-type protease/lipase transport system fused ATPase/permease subunit
VRKRLGRPGAEADKFDWARRELGQRNRHLQDGKTDGARHRHGGQTQAAGWGAVTRSYPRALAWRSTPLPGPMSSATKFSVSRTGTAEAGTAEASRRNAEVIAAMGMGPHLEAQWKEINAAYIDKQRAVNDIATRFGAISKVLRVMLQSAMLGIGAWLVIQGQATGGIIIAGSILAGRALAPVDLAIAYRKGSLEPGSCWRRLAKLLDMVPAQVNPMTLPAPNTMLVENVSIVAPGTRRVLVQDVKFALDAGNTLMVVGPSASGKSTLARALVGAWPPAAGRVRLDGADLSQWATGELDRYIGYLPQDVELFAGTVAENIARFEPNADAEAIIVALSVA